MNKKLILSTLSFFLLGGVIASTFQNLKTIEPQAAVTETKRIWAISRVFYWFSDGALFSVGTKKSDGSGYTTYQMVQDVNNFDTDGGNFSGNFSIAYYVDVPLDVAEVEFFRQNPNDSNNRFNFTGWSSYSSGMKYIFLINDTINVSTVSNYTFATTKVVQNFSESIDTQLEACSLNAAQTAINTYNAMATFDQNQFDVLDVDPGSGVTTGLQRLQYLRSFYGIATNLN